MKEFSFNVLAQNGRARYGRMITSHGIAETPAFVPVATNGSVRSLSVTDLTGLEVQLLIANAYHLHLQPGEEVIEKQGGLHQFMGWEKPLMMDSGGFQVLSLGLAKEHPVSKISTLSRAPGKPGQSFKTKKGKSLVRITEPGVEFVSYRDGSSHLFTPEKSVQTGVRLGVDIIMVLDECTSPLHSTRETLEAMDRTHRWAERSLTEFNRLSPLGQALFGIIQGGPYEDLRRKSARFIGDQPFDGIAIGGYLGNSRQ